MDRSRVEQQSYEDSYSRPSRSRANSAVSSTDGRFHNLILVDSPRSLPYDTSRPTSSTGTHSPSFITPAPPNSATFLSSTPSTQAYSSYPTLPRSELESEWTSNQNQSSDAPIVRVDLAQDYSRSSSPFPPTTRDNMSTVAVQFDPRYDLGVPRSSYTWPGMHQQLQYQQDYVLNPHQVLESGVDLLGHDLSPSVGHGSDASLTPSSGSGSVPASPPRGPMTAEQRELRRQRDQARRDSKTSVRARRALSNASYTSQSPPVTMAEFSSASTMPIYTTSPAQISLLAEPVTSVTGSYMPAYSTSPLPDPGNLPSSDYMNMGYSPGFPPTTQGLTSHYNSRPTSMSETSMLYPVPSVLPSGNGTTHDGGHVRVVQSRPKPQCWEHGCNGRQFSTFSNLLRHQREKSGQAAKATCPNCGAEFTRTTARNGHLAHDKCKQRRNS
ncbi:uncharacterized protein BCR38DRAFT_339446 [Pseudomassariella vexata]|uniref:C2H2-type domain-containing protein n=1 Tax=Pseudomassariella vexata TaxID=1141098 RepID=A0A1Y2E4G3_9PEZI|nr:uncharacterized protein BCR38DRAFT_339446 [Pseudomassariella vexata]ORY66448.1 hypothetical protein BCR38DRAFT_339446 [Pseudomassariella vexata]